MGLKPYIRGMKFKWPWQKKLVIPIDAKHLDTILNRAKLRVKGGVDYYPGEIDSMANKIAGSDATNSGFTIYITYLKEKGLIRDAFMTDGSGTGWLATVDGLLHKGFERTIVDGYSARSRENWRTFWFTIISGLGGALIGGILTLYQVKSQEGQKYLVLDSLKIRTVHDTVYVNARLEGPSTSSVMILNKRLRVTGK